LKNAKKYQEEGSGDAGISIKKNGVSFDAVDEGVLVDRKYGHGASIFDRDGDVINQRRAESLLEQALRQRDAVGGDDSKIKWEISTKAGADGISALFARNGINFEVKHVVQNEVIP
jgi:hypothetical protein